MGLRRRRRRPSGGGPGRDRTEEVRDEERGTRVQPEARPAGEAGYAIVGHDGHTHLAYALELPREPGEVQRAFRIEHEASYIVALKNPQAEPRTRGEFPDGLSRLFGGRPVMSVDPPSLLDYQGIDLVL